MDRCPQLGECIALIPDPRHARGVRHPLVALLALACAATLCGYRSYSAPAEWGRTYGVEIRRAWGFTRDHSPCAATFHQLFRRLDRVALEARLGRWVEQVVAALPEEEEVPAPAGVAIDGKTLRHGDFVRFAVYPHLDQRLVAFVAGDREQMRCLARPIRPAQRGTAHGLAVNGRRFPLPGGARGPYPPGEGPCKLRHAQSGQQPTEQGAGRGEEARMGMPTGQERAMLPTPLPTAAALLQLLSSAATKHVSRNGRS